MLPDKGIIQGESTRDEDGNDRIMRLVVEHSDRAVYRLDIASRTARSLNPERALKDGLPDAIEDVPESMIESGMVLPESVDDIRSLYDDIYSGKPSGEAKLHLRPGSRWFDVKYTNIFVAVGKPIEAVMSCLDVTDAHEHDIAYARYLQIVEGAAGDSLFFEADLASDRVERCSDGILDDAAVKGGLIYSQTIPKMIERYVAPEKREAVTEAFSRDHLMGLALIGRTQLEIDAPLVANVNGWRWVRASIQLVSDPYSGHIRVFAPVRDITAQHDEEERRRHLAETDGMTGVYNRATTERLIREILEKNDSRQCALLMLDIDKLKAINDELGHAQGDRAICTVADVMKRHFRATDIVGRVGGDEFIAFLADITGATTLRNSIASFMREISGNHVGENDERTLHVSLGYTFGVSGKDGFDEMYKQADLALYHVKSAGGNGFAFFVPEMAQKGYHYMPHSGISLKNAKWLEASEFKKLLQALSSFFPLIVSGNLTKNTYYMMEYAAYATHNSPDAGSFDELISSGAATFHPDDRDSFVKSFSRENLIAAYEGGWTSVIHDGRQRGDDGAYRWVRTAAIIMPDEGTGDLCEISLSRLIDDEKKREVEMMRLEGLLQLTVSASFEYICLLDTQNGSYELFSNDGLNTHTVPKAGDFDEATVEIRDNHIAPGERDEYYANANVATVVQRMRETDGRYTYRYRLEDGEREVAFHYYEPTRTQLLMTVRKVS